MNTLKMLAVMFASGMVCSVYTVISCAQGEVPSVMVYGPALVSALCGVMLSLSFIVED